MDDDDKEFGDTGFGDTGFGDGSVDDTQLDVTGAGGPSKRRARRPRAEGVRIIGAEEAAKALADGQAGGRRPGNAPRFGDVPTRPQGPPPVQRFPLSHSVDPASAVDRPPVVRPEMQHWTEPASGEVPRVLADMTEGGDDLEAWAALPNRGPRWRDRDSDWDESDFGGVEDLIDEAPLGALDDSRSEHSDLYSFEGSFDGDASEAEQPAPAKARVTTSIRTRRPAQTGAPPPSGPPATPRDLNQAVTFGVAMFVVALLAFKAGPVFALLLVTAVVAVAVAEYYDVVRRAGYRPATLLGITASVSLMVAAYNQGEAAIPLVLALTTIFSFLWYLFRVVQARPLLNIAATLFGFAWIGFLGSYAGLLLGLPDREGVAFLLGAVLATMAYDVGGLAFGRRLGRRPLVPDISPNKTVEGLLGGMASAVFVSVVLVGVLPGIHPWTAGSALALGLVVAVVAPLGDLCQSMLKRDIGVKDMGAILPGHGGVLDRFDALLFVLPATFYLVHLLDLA